MASAGDNVAHNPANESDSELAPTRREAMQAVLKLRKYVATLADDPFNRKVEFILGSFGQNTRAAEARDMKATKLTDYFART